MNRLDKSLDKLINDFSIDNLILFLRKALEGKNFKPDNEELDYLFSDDIYDKYESIVKIGEATIDNDDLIIIASKTNEPLTERTGKKNQYEIAKKILKHELKDASFFVFYDDEGNFRFSFIKANYLGTKRDFTDFKRYTYYVTPKQTNRTFIKQVGGCNFNSLDEIVQAFSVEPLNKQFYQDIAKSFYSLIGGKVKIGSRNVDYDASLELPSISVETNRKVYQEFAVRLIGRTIFCWFLKSKKSKNNIPLIPDSWLSYKIVIEVNNDQHNYYHTILEKLFFLVLNKKPEDRKDYSLPPDHELIPFLNGGLFEAQPDDFFPVNSQGIHQISYNLKIPNQWFIELFKTLEQYNFTIDENSIYDAEVSIDPEMLGTIFENLLAEIDPDTKKSARKATGSFYTPREIVDYMVEQSLVQYLKTRLHTDKEEQLLELFKEGGKNKFEPNETKNILTALSEVKILDPACGSGAFPMGALHKIINALHKLDPDASWWKEKQIANVPNALAKQILREKLDGESADYIRKLGVIQNSIYGVDIQPIASEISKLRSFLSLVIDETIVDNAENRGIQALPNLEFKFVTANTLIGLEENEQLQQTFDFGQTDELQEELKKIRNQYLQAYGKEKKQLKKDFENIQTQILKQETKNTAKNKRALQLASWKPFSNESNPWFDPYWMFGVEKFDIVIGNPPYKEVSNKEEKKWFSLNYKEVISKHYDLYIFFFKKGIELLKDKGVLSYLTPHTFLNYTQFIALRKFLYKYDITLLSSIITKVFENAVVDVVISQIVKSKTTKNKTTFIDFQRNKGNLEPIKIKREFQESFDSNNFTLIGIKNLKYLKKLSIGCKLLGEVTESSQGITVYAKVQGKKINYFESTKINELYKPILRGRNIKKYLKNWGGDYIKYGDWLWCQRNPKFFTNPKIFLRQTADKPIGVFIQEEFYSTDSIHSIIEKDKNYNLKFILSILNSKLGSYLYRLLIPETGKVFAQVKLTFLRKIPIKEIPIKSQKLFETLVDKIMNKKERGEDTGAEEMEIDIMVYKLYNLTYQEIKIIDPEFPLTQEEYANYQVDE